LSNTQWDMFPMRMDTVGQRILLGLASSWTAGCQSLLNKQLAI
jgi:hypothetical protein